MRTTYLRMLVVLVLCALVSPWLAAAWLYISTVWLTMIIIAVKYKRNRPLNDKKNEKTNQVNIGKSLI